MLLVKIRAYFLKELQEQLSYRLEFAMRFASALFFVLLFFYLARMIGKGAAPHLKIYRGDYFSYVLIGIIFHSYLTTALHAFSQTIRSEQMTGTLEHLLVTPTPPWVMLLGGMLWRFVFDGFHLLLVLVVGIVWLNAHYVWSGVPAAMIALVLTLVSQTAIGLIAGGFVIIFKRGDPVTTLFGFFTALLGGVYYPLDVLPHALRTVSAFLPLTYSVRLVRDACIRGLPLSALGHDLAALALLCAVLFPLGVFFFGWAVRRARADGTLGQY